MERERYYGVLGIFYFKLLFRVWEWEQASGMNETRDWEITYIEFYDTTLNKSSKRYWFPFVLCRILFHCVTEVVYFCTCKPGLRPSNRGAAHRTHLIHHSSTSSSQPFAIKRQTHLHATQHVLHTLNLIQNLYQWRKTRESAIWRQSQGPLGHNTPNRRNSSKPQTAPE